MPWKQYPARDFLTVAIDGISRTVSSCDRIKLSPGQSICIAPGTIHQFWGEGGNGFVVDGVMYGVSGEVSSVCDDRNDNVFISGKGCRFPKIDEDEEARHYLCHEYLAG